MLDFPVILASASPRRLQLLQQIGLKPIVRAADVDERILGEESPQAHAERLAAMKGRAIVDEFGDDSLVISADTIVVLDDSILGKPRDISEAKSFLIRLSGREHLVITAVSLFWKTAVMTRSESTSVEFIRLSKGMIDVYLKTGDYRDKAGGYGIQSFSALFIPRINGCFFNVMGFPIHLFYRMLTEMEMNPF